MTTHNVSSPILGTVFKISVKPGDTVRANREILILESMK
ncbi:MAG: biotin/lipoyl-containing protein, partial [Ilumatobacteraceae bacterium]